MEGTIERKLTHNNEREGERKGKRKGKQRYTQVKLEKEKQGNHNSITQTPDYK